MKKLFQASWQKDHATKKGIIATLPSEFLIATLHARGQQHTLFNICKKCCHKFYTKLINLYVTRP